MAAFMKSLLLLLACTLLPIIQSEIICENLPISTCAFSVSSYGKRCLIEDTVLLDGKVDYKCKTSEVVVGSSTSDYIETDKCVKTCGVDRKSVGMSSDPFLDSLFMAKLCARACYDYCPNLVDLYANIAAGEGVFLPELCEQIRSGEGSRRGMAEIQSGGGDSAAAPAGAPAAGDDLPRRAMIGIDAEAPSPA
ncbi:PREDICTED: uncharacterized protein LOC109180043 [Ipomoea nil]|uniref:uncharacterized protein LOC109180043 n=1 Tax=Ipomoea nil TaxID=35883 RepID=UPI000900F204|nr:PREDICTED: uncharacterized protein LOC109180043 [Ipomoea nil]